MKKLFLRLTLFILALGLAACGQVKADLSAQSQPTRQAPTPQAATPTTAAVEAAVVTEAAPVDECVACHTNKELLIQVAEPEVKTESESEGTG